MEDSHSCVNLGLLDDGLEVGCTTRVLSDIVLIGLEHYLNLDIICNGVGQTKVEHDAILSSPGGISICCYMVHDLIQGDLAKVT